MRICHGLLGEAIEVEDRELQRQRPLEIVRQRTQERWGVDPDDLIVLAGGGAVLGPSSGVEDVASGRDVFIFLRGMLDPQCGRTSAEEVSRASPSRPSSPKSVIGPAAEGENVRLEGAEEEAGGAVEDGLRAVGALAGDPVFENFWQNVAQARRYLAEARPSVIVAGRMEVQSSTQRLAVQAVLDNLTSNRATCSRSLELFVHKHERVQGRLEQNLANVDEAMEALRQIPLHSAVRTSSRETLADAIPQDRIARFATKLHAERTRLGQQLDKLKAQDANAQNLCDQAATKVQQLLQDDSVELCVKAIQQKHARALELLPALGIRLPQVVGTEPLRVLEEEKRCSGVLKGLSELCRDLLGHLDDMRQCWETRAETFLQRLREVSFAQSKVRSLERQAALLEEQVNAHHSSSRQLDHLTKMPRAYQKALSEVARRREFRERYIAQGEQARSTLTRMMENENRVRRSFVQRYGCHLPADLVKGLGSLVPPAPVEVPEFDTQLPDIGLASSSGQEAASTGSTSGTSRPRVRVSARSSIVVSGSVGGPSSGGSGGPVASTSITAASSTPTGGSVVAVVAASSASSCSSSLQADPGASSMHSAASGSGSGRIERSGTSGGFQAQAVSCDVGDTASAVALLAAACQPTAPVVSTQSVAESEEACRRELNLENRNRELQQRVNTLIAELAAAQEKRQLDDLG